MNDSRVRIGAVVVGALVIAVSLGVVNVSHTASRLSKVVAVLPASPLNIPMLRQLPPPEPKKGDVVSVRTAKAPKARVLTARR